MLACFFQSGKLQDYLKNLLAKWIDKKIEQISRNPNEQMSVLTKCFIGTLIMFL